MMLTIHRYHLQYFTVRSRIGGREENVLIRTSLLALQRAGQCKW